MQTSPLWFFGPFTFDRGACRVLRDGVPLSLEPKAFDVLGLLLERAPGVVEKSEIFAVVWKDVAVTDNALTRVIAQLRKALDDDARNPVYIETIATRGYRIAAEVRAGESTPRTLEPAPFTATTVPAPSSAPAAPVPASGRSRLGAGALAVAMLVLLAVGGVAWRSSRADVAANAGDRSMVSAPLALLRPAQLTTGSGVDTGLAFSYDGTTVAYASDRSGAFEIWVQGLASGAVPTRLTSGGGQKLQPTWSPDGRFIAYYEAADGGIWIVPSRGGTARRVASQGSRPDWSPDGRTIAFQTYQPTDLLPSVGINAVSTIQAVDVDTGQTRAMTTMGSPPGPHFVPRWSSDGARLFFAVAPPAFAQEGAPAESAIWSVGRDGTGLRREASGPLLAPEFVPSPDGRGAWTLARTASLWWQPFRDRAAAQPSGLTILGLPAHPSLARDGKRLAWTTVTAVSGLWSVDIEADGSAGVPAPLALGSGIRATGAVASPDGRLVYSAMVRGRAPQVWLRDASGAARQITLDEGDHLQPLWLSNYREVAFSADHDGVTGFSTVDVTTGTERLLFERQNLPAPPGTRGHPVETLNVVPDAGLTRVAMTLEKDGVYNVWLATLVDGRPDGGVRQLTFERQGGSFPHWSPDGRSVSYQCDDGPDTHVCVIDVDGRERRQLTAARGQSFIGGWQGNDAILVAARRGAIWNVRSVEVRTGQERVLTSFTDARSYVRYPQWDPAGRRVVFERAETTANIWTVELPGERP